MVTLYNTAMLIVVNSLLFIATDGLAQLYIRHACAHTGWGWSVLTTSRQK